MKYIILYLTMVICFSLLVSCSKNTTPQSNIIATVAEDNVNTDTDLSEDADSNNAFNAKSTPANNDVTISTDVVAYTNDDYYSAWENQNPNYIDLKGSYAVLTGNGATIENGKITINTPGVYVFNGEINEGQIIVNLQIEGSVQIVLNGASIHCSDFSPIYIKKADKAILSLPEGTENEITDGKTYDLSEKEHAINAAIYSTADLTINGTGSLTLLANYKNGIVSNKTIKITDGSLDITSKKDALIGKNMIAALGGTLILHAGGDGMKSTYSKNAKNLKGIVVLDGGNFIITSNGDGIKATNSLLITGGEYSIVSGGGSEPQNTGETSEDSQENTGETEPVNNRKATENQGLYSESITINGGIFTIDSSGDSVYGKDTITINDGNLTISSLGDGLRADSSVYITNGTITVTNSDKGVEGSDITVLDGNIRIFSSGDGFYIAGGKDSSASEALNNQEGTKADERELTLNGGYIYIETLGDGIDANGSVEITEGTVIINGSADGEYSAVNYTGTFKISGGVFMAAGVFQKVTTPASSSSQSSITYTFQKVQKENTLFHIEDKKGNELITFAPNVKYQNILVSTPDIKQGKAYSIYINGSSNGESMDGYYTNGTYEKGTKLMDFTMSDKVTRLND